jgi:hypothetical protein
VTGERGPDRSGEPSVDVIEALVRSIAAREAGVAEAAPTDPARPLQRPVAPRGPIAGLIGRLEWERLVADESERQRRYSRPSAIVLAEVVGPDPRSGEGAAGPAIIGRVVPACAEALLALTRASDRVTRLGDARFGILLRESDASGASRYAARAVAACDPWLGSMPWPLRLVAVWASLDDADPTGAMSTAEGRLAAASRTPRRDRP